MSPPPNWARPSLLPEDSSEPQHTPPEDRVLLKAMSDAGVLDEPLAQSPRPGSAVAGAQVIGPLQAVVEDAERVHIRRALEHCEGSVSKTAEMLAISRKTLWEKMKRLAISN